MMSSRGMGAIAPNKMPGGKRKARRDDTDFTEYAEGGEVKAEPKVKPTFTHEVVDTRTGQVMGQYQSSSTANRGADRLDNKYGGYRYQARPIKSGSGTGGGGGAGMLDELMAEGGEVKAAGGGLYANIAAKKRRIAAGSGEKMRSAGSKGAPKPGDFANAAKTASYKEGGDAKSKVNEAGNYTKPGMRKSLFDSIKASATQGTAAGQWSARKAQLLAKKYKAKGGGYKD